MFWPNTIIEQFEKYKVLKEFDLLSVDTDNYDFFMLEKILWNGYRPRVIIVEINSNFETTEAKSIMPPGDGKSWKPWDGTAYHGMSLLALSYLFNRFSYSMVWCNKINCVGVQDAALGHPLRLPVTEFNAGRLGLHPCDKTSRKMAIITPEGTFNGDTDGGQGSPYVRCKKY